MQDNLRLNLRFDDRVGIVADISRALAEKAINIAAMEVARIGSRVGVYLELETPHKSDHQAVFTTLGEVEGMRRIEEIRALPREKRENTFREIINNISEGVLAIDNRGKVTAFNTVAQNLVGIKPGDPEGMEFNALGLEDASLLECLKGKSFANEKKSGLRGTSRYHYFSTVKPIVDKEGITIGALEIMKDMGEIRDLARAATDHQQVTFSDITGASPEIKAAITLAQKVATTDATITISGESGTGKELFARAIHHHSRPEHPFVAVNTAALPESLLESELFGYAPGAFTGASKHGKPGLFEAAGAGTIFLDEIGEMPLSIQVKLLRVIQEMRVRRIGGQKEVDVKCRIITATNRELSRMVDEGSFRKDLFYRISIIPIQIPPLSERADDIPALAEHFLDQLAHSLKRPAQRLTSAAMAELTFHPWPGNVRELKNVIMRAAILSDGKVIDRDSISFGALQNAASAVPGGTIGPRATPGKTLREQIDAFERNLLQDILQNAGSIRQAARRLGVSHTTLLNKIKKHALYVAR